MMILTLEGVVDIDIDDFLSGCRRVLGLFKGKLLQDPYKRGGMSNN
jgi:hypothetical protein